jgi:hypothetical protein
MPVYIHDPETGRMIDKKTGEPMVPDEQMETVPPLPMTFGDLPGYASPITGEWIDGRRARRYDMEKHGCVDGNDVNKPRKLKNERFVKKHGLEHLAE